ncbi:hypothetical protein [Aquicella lusitana]|uniref:Uncharacterized protein n=1 Tax=Aquicella lusitana TaxID=254246 RepID=A0A370GFF1_9COXI|nr:hypothetical protein [Aquicella lusitana]RDI41134.1 hypothetical protein C8D86_12132 [Aquicella lusitana]VVC74657.1 hypothetical protein AQULUS_24230 [Aquicella lusitana]
MEQITMKVDDAVFEKIKARMEKNGCKTLAQCARELLELGLRIEEAAANQEAGGDENDMLATLLNLTKTNTQWVLETRFFVKFLMENWNRMESSQLSLFMDKAKERAAVVVHEMVGQPANAALHGIEGG